MHFLDKPNNNTESKDNCVYIKFLKYILTMILAKYNTLPSPGVIAPWDRTFGILKFDVTEETGPTGDNPGIEVLNTNLDKIIINKWYFLPGL